MTVLYEDPNRFAQFTGIQKNGDSWRVGGYQSFVISDTDLKAGAETQRKMSSISELVSFKDKRVLDLGCNSGFSSFYALRAGASSAVGIDLDPIYITATNEIGRRFFPDNYTAHQVKVQDLPLVRYDIVFGFALVHWLYSCTATFGSLDAIVRFLAVRTNEQLVLEFVGPNDGAVRNFRHTSFNTETHEEPYTEKKFLEACEHYFDITEKVCEVRNHRTIYVLTGPKV